MDDELVRALISINEALLSDRDAELDESVFYSRLSSALSRSPLGAALLGRNGERVEVLCSSPHFRHELLLDPGIGGAVLRALGGGLVRLDPSQGCAGKGDGTAAVVAGIPVEGEPAVALLVHTGDRGREAEEYARLMAQHLSLAIGLVRERRRESLILDTLPAYVYIKDEGLNIIYRNRFFEENIGNGSSLGRKCYEVAMGCSSPCPGCPSLRSIGKAGTEKHEWTSRDGRTYMNIHRSYESGGKTFFLSIGIDITELKEAEEALRSAMLGLKELSFIINKSPAVSFLWRNEEGWPVEYVTDNVSAFGYKAEDFISGGLKFAELVHPDDLARVASEVSEFTRQGASEFEQEYRIITRDGRVRWVRDYTWIRRSATGEATHFQGIVIDATEIVLAKEALRNYASSLEEEVAKRTEQLREKERLAAIGEAATMVGHDLRNPLQAITNLIWLADEEADKLGERSGGEKLAEICGRMKKQVRYMDKIVSDLNDYSRAVQPKFEQVDLGELIRDAVSNVPAPSDVGVRVEVDQCLGQVETDPYLLKRCLVNLVTNAVQAMPSGGELSVRASPDGGECHFAISVSDTGVGIPPEVRNRLFEPFVTGKPRGMGMGLAVVKKFVEAMGGSVRVESCPSCGGGGGGGTTFTLRLPRSRGTPPS